MAVSKQQVPLVTLTFIGPRFEDHGLDVTVLPELMAYRKVLVKTAEEIWRVRHPGRTKRPANFDQRIVLKIAALREGSVAVALVREMDSSDNELPFVAEDEITEAARLLDETIEAASEDLLPPAGIPAAVIPQFAELGKSLRDGEQLLLQAEGRPKPACFDAESRRRLAAWTEKTYLDSVDLQGEVTSADVEGGQFTLKQANGVKVKGKFSPDQEEAVTEALRSHRTLRLRVEGQGEFDHRDATLRRFIGDVRVEIRSANEDNYDSNEPPVWKMIDELIADVPDSVFERLPADGAANHDRYLHHGCQDER